MPISEKLGSLFRLKKKALTLTEPDALALFGAIPTRSGIQIGPGSAMRVPAVNCAVGLISDSVGTMPAKLYNRADKTAISKHPAHRLVHDEANEWTSASELRRQLTVDALLNDKGGFAHVVRLDDSTPAELHRLDPSTVTQDFRRDGEPFYTVRTDRGVIEYPFTDILHIQAFGGVSPISLGREAIGLATAFEKHIASLFANGGRPSGIILAKKVMDTDAKKKLASSWFKTHSGENAGGTALLDEGMDYRPLSMTLTDAQFAENRLEQIREIARVFRVPPTMLFELTRGTWSNTEEMSRQFYTVTLKPWLVAWEWAYARVLLSPEERREHYIEFITADLLSTNETAKAEAYAKYRAMGALTANEVREGLNRAPHDDGNNLANPYTTPGQVEDINNAA